MNAIYLALALTAICLVAQNASAFSTGVHTFPEDCEKTKQCIFWLTWSSHETQTNLTLITSFHESQDPGQKWSAFAFSKDQFMGDDDVYLCNGASGSMRHLQTFGKFLPVLQHQGFPILGLSSVSVQRQNSMLVCSFSRDNSITSGFKNYANLASGQTYYLLFAFGPASHEDPVSIGKHEMRAASSTSILFV